MTRQLLNLTTATRASAETGERIVSALIPRIVQVCREMAGKEQSS